jgi:LysM repeat protein
LTSRARRLGRWALAGLIVLQGSAFAATTKEGCGASVKIAAGETLSSIAQRCNTTLPDLVRANPQIRNPDLVPAGAVLALPQRGKPAIEKEPDDVSLALAVEPRTAARGTPVTISAEGLPPKATVWIKGGRQQSGRYHLMIRSTRSRADGTLRATVKVPSWANPGPKGFHFSVEVPRSGASLASVPVEVLGLEEATAE